MEQMPQQPQLRHASDMESMKSVFENIAQTHYLFSHQTSEDVAQKIYQSNFEVSPGTGISGRLTWVGAESLLNQVQRQLAGDSHRGTKGMIIIAVPKEILDAKGIRNKAEALEDILLESDEYGKNNNPNLIIPSEYNFGYLEGTTFYYKA